MVILEDKTKEESTNHKNQNNIRFKNGWLVNESYSAEQYRMLSGLIFGVLGFDGGLIGLRNLTEIYLFNVSNNQNPSFLEQLICNNHNLIVYGTSIAIAGVLYLAGRKLNFVKKFMEGNYFK